MKDMTVSEFCQKFEACQEGRQWAYMQLPERSKAKMSAIWPLLVARPDDLRWVATREGVFSDRDLRLMACRFVRETPLVDGRKVWDLLTDDRSRNAITVSERFAIGEATKEELAAADAAAGAATRDAALDAALAARAALAAGAAAGDAALAAAWAAARAATRDAALDAALAARAALAAGAALAARAAGAAGDAGDAAGDAASDYQAHIIMSYGNPFIE